MHRGYTSGCRCSSSGTKERQISKMATGYRALSTGTDSRRMSARPRFEISILAAAKNPAKAG